MSNIFTKVVGRALSNLGERIARGEIRASDIAPRVSPQGVPSNAPGTRTNEGDYLAAMLPEPINPRSQRGAVIRELTTNRAHFRWQYNCIRCGNPNFVGVGDESRTVECGHGCGHKFSIRGVALDAIKTARAAANRTRGTSIGVDKPVSDAEWDTWRFSLPERMPSQETSPREAMVRKLQQQLGEVSGDVEWTGEKYAESLDSGLAFSNPGSGSWRH